MAAFIYLGLWGGPFSGGCSFCDVRDIIIPAPKRMHIRPLVCTRKSAKQIIKNVEVESRNPVFIFIIIRGYVVGIVWTSRTELGLITGVLGLNLGPYSGGK